MTHPMAIQGRDPAGTSTLGGYLDVRLKDQGDGTGVIVTNVAGTVSSAVSGSVATTADATAVTLLAASTETASGAGAGVAVGTLRELLVVLNVTAASGTSPSLTVEIDSSVDGGTTWVKLQTFAAVTAVGVAQISLGAPSAAFGNLIRASWTVSGTTPSFTFSVLAVGK